MTPDDDRENPQGSSARILLVDDDTNFARQLEDHLVDATLVAGQVDHVSTLAEALVRLQDRASRPDAVLLDLTLPDASGIETVRAIVEAAPDLPVVVLTPSDDLRMALAALRERAEDCLPKDEAGPEHVTRSVQFALERKRIQRELTEARRKLSLLDEHLQEVFYLWDFSTEPPTLAYCSSAYEKIWGRPVEEVTQDPLTFIEGIHPEDRERVRENLEAKLRGERHLDYRVSRPDGELRWIRDRSYPIRDEDGEVRWIAGTAVDITQQKDLETDLAQERTQLEEIFREAPAFLAVVRGEDHVFERANPTYRNLVGNRKLLGRPVREVFPEIDDEFFDILDQVYHTGEPYHADEQPIDLDTGNGNGIERHYLNFVYQPLAEAGEVNGILVHGVDVTEQRDNREALRQSEARHRTLVETMAEATVILDADGRITFANTEAEDVLGLKESEIRGRTYKDLDWAITSPDGGPLPESALPFRRVMETGETVRNLEHAITRTDGRRTVLSVNAAPMVGESTGGERVVATIRDITKQKQLEEMLQHQALHDPLTGLANRTLFEDRLEHAVARSRRGGEPMGLLMIDVNDFKRVNDHLGHTAGDEVLEEVARRLEATVRETDTVARWGGDEFVVVLPELDQPAMIEAVQHRLRNAVGVPIPAGGEKLELGVTVGGVVRASGDVPRTVGTDDPEDLIRFVDLALHRAKGQSPSGFYLFDPTDDLDEVPDLRLEQDLRRGLRAGEIEIFYQPIYRLEDEELRGFEALARWRHPERGLVLPGAFIPLAERVGLIRELGEEVFRQACRQLATWIRTGQGGSNLMLSINLSAHELQDPGLPGRMAEALEETELPSDRVVVEVTETALMTSVGQARALGAMGLALFIDDFGTGYSTFTYLRTLRPQGLKIDMSLVRDLPESTSDLAIVESLLTLGRRLGLRVVAEGIETDAQLRTLRDLGAELGQGFLLGRPAAADEIEGLLDGVRTRSRGR